MHAVPDVVGRYAGSIEVNRVNTPANVRPPRLELFHIPPSFYAQVARLALTEMGLAWEDVWIVAGPPRYENYSHDYVRLNNAATVPTLRIHRADGGPPLVLTDSKDIVEWASNESTDPELLPDDRQVRREVDHWLGIYRSISVRELTYGKLRRFGAFFNRRRLRFLRGQLLSCRHEGDAQALEEIYGSKIEDVEQFSRAALDSDHVGRILSNLNRHLDELNSQLSSNKWIAGDSYTLADLVWTVLVARLLMMKTQPFENRTHLALWYERVRVRPSFESAKIWERPHPEQVLPIAMNRFGAGILIGIVTIALIILLMAMV